MGQIDTSLLELETPHILLDQDRLQANIPTDSGHRQYARCQCSPTYQNPQVP